VGIRRQLSNALGNMPGEIAESLEVAVDPQHGGHPAQVGSHRLMQCEHLQAFALDPQLPAINAQLLALDLVGKVDASIAECAHTPIQRLFDNGSQLQDSAPEPFHVPEEMSPQADSFHIPVGSWRSSILW